MKIIIIDDETDACNALSLFVKKLDHQVMTAYDGQEALKLITENQFDLIISDINLPYYNGIDIVHFLKDRNYEGEIILISGIDDIIHSINAMELGILDFLTKPVNIKKLVQLINCVNENRNQSIFTKKKEEINQHRIYIADIRNKIVNANNKHDLIYINNVVFPENYSIHNEFIGQIGIFSRKMFSIYRKLKKLDEYQHIPVLIEGETGTGKEILAKYIHYENQKIKGPFIAINCSNLTHELFNAEMFGYDKGAFTGADIKGKDGKLKHAENGTLFLDEITELSLDLQAKLLRVLQEREYYKIGSNHKERVKTRIVAAANKNIKNLVDQKQFRDDLYYRFNVCSVLIPPLRERKDEIIPLTLFLLKTISDELGKKIEAIEVDGLKLLEEIPWYGNIRELKNVLTKFILFEDSKILTAKILNQFILKEDNTPKPYQINMENLEIPETPFNLNELNEIIIKKTLEKFKGNKSKTAKFLGLTRIQLYGKYKV